MTNPTTTDTDPLWTLSQRKGLVWRTFVVPDVKVMYVQVNKNACTSIKWMIAGIAGENLAAFGPSLEASINRADDIHDRRQWKKVPRLDRLDPEVRTRIHPDNGWFVFSVTRDPRTRLFSAWQSKLLLDNPGYLVHRDKPWYPHHPSTADSVVEDFEKFVDLFERRPDVGIRRDGHFRDQVEMLHEDLVPYSEIYDIRELGRFKADLRTHLDGLGWEGELDIPRFNDTPLRPNAQPFADGVRERVEKLYAADFERFGDRWDYGVLEQVPEWTTAALAEVDAIAETSRRIGFLLDQARTARDEATAQRKRADAEKARADKLSAQQDDPAAALPWRAHLRVGAEGAAGAVRRRIRNR